MIRFEQVHKLYGPHHALRDVSFTVNEGELAFLVGPSGSGKTTILKLLDRELRADAGRVLIDGADLGSIGAHRVPALRRVVASVPQEHRLLANRNVAGNIAFALAVQGWRTKDARARIHEVLDLVGLAGYGERMPHELSGGERQRVTIARAVAGRPALLLADEPTGNLDPSTSVGIIRLLSSIARHGTTVLVSTHDQPLVDSMRVPVIELSAGEVVRAGLGRYSAAGEGLS